MRPSRVALAVLASLAALVPLAARSPLAAQQRDTTRADTARADSSRRVQRLGPTIITGTRLTDVDERTPVQVDRVELGAAAPGPAAAAQALQQLPGVSVFDDQGTRVQPTLDIRGFTLSPVIGVPQGVSVFLDGVRINEPDAQEVNFDLIPMEAIDHAELVRGPATLFGKNTLGGALVLFTKRGEATPHLSAELQGGAFGFRGARVSASGARAGIDAFLMARASEEDGYRDVTPARTRTVFLNLGRKRDSSDLALTVLHAHDRLMQAGSLPESWLRVDRRANYTSGDFFEPNLTHLAVRGEHTLAGGTLRGNLFHRRNDTEQFNVNIAAPSTRAFVGNRSTGGAVEWSLPTQMGALPLALTVGVEYSRNDVTYRILSEPTPEAPEVEEGCDPASRVCEDARVNEDDAAVFAQGMLQVSPKLAVTASARADYVRVPFRDLRDPDNDGTSTFRRFSPRLGITYALSDRLRGYAAVSTGFRAPAALELACADEAAPCPLPFSLGDDPPLEPVSVVDYEAGIDWEPRSGLLVDVVAFREDVRNEIAFVASRTTAGFFQNLPRTRRQGVEASSTIPLPAGLRVFGSYTFLDATYRSTVLLASALPEPDTARPGDRFPLSPAHRGTAGIGITRVIGPSVLDAELAVQAVGSQFLRGNDANLERITLPSGAVVSGRLPGYAVSQLRLRYERERFAIAADVTNLFDRRYVNFGLLGENPIGAPGGPSPPEPVLERFLNPGYPRAVTISLEVKR